MISHFLAPTPTMIEAVSKGRYFWQLRFHYDNSTNEASIEHDVSFKKTKTVHLREFLATKFNIASGFTFRNKASTDVKLVGSSVSGETEYTFHLDLAYEIAKQSESITDVSTEEIVSRKYTIGPKSKLDLYQLCYVNDGVAYQADVFSTSPKEEIVVEVKFRCTKRVLGLNELSMVLLNTNPEHDNIGEWNAIHAAIVQASDRSEEEAFKHLVEQLGRTEPDRHNKGEWAAIRATCSEILKAWDNREKMDLFRKLLMILATTKPGSSNVTEWEVIRNTCNSILGELKVIF